MPPGIGRLYLYRQAGPGLTFLGLARPARTRNRSAATDLVTPCAPAAQAETGLTIPVPGERFLFNRRNKRAGAPARQRLRSIRTTSTIIRMRTTVPIPIYIDYSFPRGFRRRTPIRFLASSSRLGSVQLPTHEPSNRRARCRLCPACDRTAITCLRLASIQQRGGSRLAADSDDHVVSSTSRLATHWSPRFSNLCFSTENAARTARSPSP